MYIYIYYINTLPTPIRGARYYAKEISTEIPELEVESRDAQLKHLERVLQQWGKVGGT